MTKKQTDPFVMIPPQLKSSVGAGAVVGASGKSTPDVGYIYAPYVPLYVTSTNVTDFSMRVANSPLEDLVEGVFKEEIDSGELKPLRSKSRFARYIHYDFNRKFSTVSITNL